MEVSITMKTTYINPEIQILSLSEEDVIRTSTPFKFGAGDWGIEDNL